MFFRDGMAGWIYQFYVRFLQLFIFALCLSSCASKVTRSEAIATAYKYTQVTWMPEERHIRHGKDSNGIMVHTPDSGLKKHGDPKGWWVPGQQAKSMPYQWGGFDTPESFLKKIKAGYKAGDIASADKLNLLEAGTSKESCGIDCSGFVSRCWNLKRPYSTRELHKICDKLSSWEELKPGDILLNDRHVVLFVEWIVPGKELVAYEAGPYPVWRVSAAGLYAPNLIENGYAPWRYRGIKEDAKKDQKLKPASIPGLAREWR